jgi:hypothetical protein
VNRSGAGYAHEVRLADGRSVPVATDHGTVAWARVEPDGSVSAAMVDGTPGRAGSLEVAQGLASLVFARGAWEVIVGDRTDVVVPAAAGWPVWRVMLDGRVLACGEVGKEGLIHCLPEDDAGMTDRYVLGDRSAADAVAAPVAAFVASSWAEGERAMDRLTSSLADVDDPDLLDLRARLEHRDLGDLAKSLARLRSRIHAGTADTVLVAAQESLTSIAVRLHDLDLGRT